MLAHEVDRAGAVQEAWERFVESERLLLEQRRDGSLARELGGPLPGESAEELWWLAIEDRGLAEEGLVELRGDGKVWHKRVEDLTSEDRRGRIEAEDARAAWLGGRSGNEAEAAE